jgi:hypothetical protein
MHPVCYRLVFSYTVFDSPVSKASLCLRRAGFHVEAGLVNSVCERPVFNRPLIRPLCDLRQTEGGTEYMSDASRLWAEYRKVAKKIRT